MTKPRHRDGADLLDRPQRVRVYRNLHRGCLSVQHRTEDGRWIVAGHCDQIALEDVRYRVSEAGRRRVIEEQRKNVHAVIEGISITAADWQSRFDEAQAGEIAAVGYNPYRVRCFVVATSEGLAADQPVLTSEAAQVTTRGATALRGSK